MPDYRIATEGDAHTIGGGSPYTSNMGCTKSRALALGCSLQSPSSGYSDNQLVRYDNLYVPGVTYRDISWANFNTSILRLYNYYHSPKYTFQCLDSDNICDIMYSSTVIATFGFSDNEVFNGTHYGLSSYNIGVGGDHLSGINIPNGTNVTFNFSVDFSDFYVLDNSGSPMSLSMNLQFIIYNNSNNTSLGSTTIYGASNSNYTGTGNLNIGTISGSIALRLDAIITVSDN